MLHKLFLQAGYLGFWAGSWLGSAWADEKPAAPEVIDAKIVLLADENVAEPKHEVFLMQRQPGGAHVKRLQMHVPGHAIPAHGAAGHWVPAEKHPHVFQVIGKPLAGEQSHGGKVIILRAHPAAKHGKAPMLWVAEGGHPHDVSLAWVKADDEDEADEAEEEEAEESEDEEAEEAEIEIAAQAEVKLSDFYIGVECYPVEEAVRKQLKLGDTGLWIEGVVDDSPAAKAGFQQSDVLVAADGEDLKEVADLVAAIDKAKDSEIKFTVVRDGQRETIKATPAKREQGDVIVNVPEAEGTWEMLEKIRPGQDTQFRFFNPGVVVDEEKYEFPENMKISITREGKGPAQVVVERGDDKWTTTSDKLDSLPEDVRPHVERMVGGGPMRMMLRSMPERAQGRAEVAARALERARAAAERAQGAAKRARGRVAEEAEEAEEAGEAGGDRLNRLMGRIEKLFEEKAEMLEKLLEEKAQEVEKRIEEKSQEHEENDDE